MDKKSIEKLSDETKQIISPENPENVIVSVRVSKKPAVKLPQNIMVFQAFAMLAALKLKPTTNQVLMLLFGLSAYENYIGIDIKTIQENLGEISVRSIVRALKELEDEKIIIKLPHPTDKRRNDYFINPTAAWKGNSYARAKRIKLLVQNQAQLELFGD